MDNKERFIEIFTSQIHRPGAAELLEWMESTDFFEAPKTATENGSGNRRTSRRQRPRRQRCRPAICPAHNA